jgi:limonene 1,2-monooxygenase
MALPDRLRFGAFIAPHHTLEENPSLCLHRDMELVEHLDRLGYDEAWIGEHHSAGYETIASPEVFIAAAAERTRHIRLGTGVSSLPYHHPLILADRIVQLDHMTRGRIMFGVGPGALSSDAHMMGITVGRQRAMMEEAINVLVPLLRGETVTAQTDWFTLKEARIQMLPWSRPEIEMAVASLISPSGARAAGRHGLGLLSIQATSKSGFNALASNWAIAEQVATDNGHVMDRAQWRLVGQMHVAETREEAVADIRFGLSKWLAYFKDVANLPLVPDGVGDPIEAYLATDAAIVGTPDDAIERIALLQEESGGFGAFLLFAHNWANGAATRKSYEMIARYVMPHFQQLNVNRYASYEWVKANRPRFGAESRAAVAAAIAEHETDKGRDHIRPGLRETLVGPGGKGLSLSGEAAALDTEA